MRYAQIPINLFKEIQLNAGILTDFFNPATGKIGNILGATSGGVTFNATPTYEDFGADIDNCPKGTMELKKQTDISVTLSGTFVSTNSELAKRQIGAGDIDALDATKIVPRRDLSLSDFKSLWWIGDYSDKNGNKNGGFVAIQMLNTLSTGGFQIKSTENGKGNFAFTFMAHFSIENPDEVPYNVYIKAGSAEDGSYYMSVLSVAGSTVGYTAVTLDKTASSSQLYVYQTGTNLRIPPKGSILNGNAWALWDGDDEIQSESGLDMVMAIVDSETLESVYAGKTIVTVKES